MNKCENCKYDEFDFKIEWCIDCVKKSIEESAKNLKPTGRAKFSQLQCTCCPIHKEEN